jgi:hypothetical protein
MFQKFYFIGIILVLGLILFFTFGSEEKKEQYAEKIKAEREEKNTFFRSSPQSPIKKKDTFLGLNYFPADEKFRIEANLETSKDTATFLVSRTDGTSERLPVFGFATFTLEGKRHRLLLLKHAQENSLFLAFTDKTSGETTYGGGRYLDLPYKKGQKKMIIDFNMAYNPYCAYDATYSCPLPPKENRLSIDIKAGEMNFEK